MKAIVRTEYGSPAVLRVEEIEIPTAGDGQVLVRVRAASVNPLDWHDVRGSPSIMRMGSGLRSPKRPGLGADFAGEVEAVGSGVSGFQLGDDVFGEAKSTFAEYAAVPVQGLALKPGNLSFEEAAAVPVAGLTALQGLRDKGRVQPGQKVLINGAAGGVGTIAVQIGKWLGSEVTGVCSTRNVDMVRSLGADEVIDYTQNDFAASERQYDVVFDLVGNRSFSDLRGAMTPAGTLILSSGAGSGLLGPLVRLAGGVALSPFIRQKILAFLANSNQDDMNTIKELIEAGKVSPVIDRTYPLQETAEAIRYLEEGHARGKVVIRV